jgi:hypothetical protein
MSILRGLDIEEYHKHPALSHSKLWDWAQRTPKWWKDHHVLRLHDNEDDVLVFDGESALDEQFATAPATYPSSEKPTAKNPFPPTIQKPWIASAGYCKDWIAEREAEGLTVLSAEERRLIFAMFAECLANRHFAAMLRAPGSESQVSFRWKDTETGIEFQSRPDLINHREGWYLDLKSSRALANHGKAFIGLGYHIQAAIVERAMRAHDMPCNAGYHMVVEKSLYPRADLMEISGANAGPVFVEYGWSHAVKLALEIENARTSGVFAYRQDRVGIIRVPEWIQRKMMEGDEMAPEEVFDFDDMAEVTF